MDQIILCQCYILEKTFLHRASTIFVQGNNYPNIWKILRTEYLISQLSKKGEGKNGIICSKIQTSISLWEEALETVIEKNEKSCSSIKNFYYWLRYDGLKKVSR